ncbi:MAG: type III-A CRISPR-associated RAMP protein Csm4 [Anaerolineae bacterium]
MAYIAYRLIPPPGGGFHLGREGLDQEESAESFPSDSLFAALAATLLELEGAQAVRGFKYRSPRLSSVFPCVGDLLLFPMPRLGVNLSRLDRPGMTKTVRKLQYVSAEILGRLLRGQPMDDWLPENSATSKGLWLQGGRVWISDQERQLLPADWQKLSADVLKTKRIWKVDRVPRVAVDRVTNSSQIYHVGRTTFASGCGLWFLADVEPEQEDWFTNLLQHLGDRGLGGERSAGYGAFTVEQMKAPALPPVDRVPRVMTLSRYNPTKEEWEAGVLGEGASYDLVDVGGWLISPDGPAQRRKRVRMIEAGSVLVQPEGMTVTGRIVDVRPEYQQDGGPEHPVYRSGIALTVGVTGGT